MIRRGLGLTALAHPKPKSWYDGYGSFFLGFETQTTSTITLSPDGKILKPYSYYPPPK